MALKLLKIISHLVAWLPLVWLVYGAFARQLGGDPQEKILHELGAWGLIFLLLSLSMTPMRNLIPQFPWIRFRRMLGLFAAFYLLLHLMSYIAFYLFFDFSMLADEIIKRPYIAVGFTALVALVPLVFTSTKAAQRRLGKRWKKLHRLVYPIAVLSITHYIWQSKSDLNEPFIYLFWLIILFAARFYDYRQKLKRTAQANSRRAGQELAENR